MPRPSKHAIEAPAMPDMAGLEAFERAADMEAAKWNEVSKETRLGYEAKAKKLASPNGYAFHAVSPATRDAYKAAGLWVMRRRLKKILKDAKRLRKKGETGKKLFGVRVAMWEAKLQEANTLLEEINALRAVKCRVSLSERRKRNPEACNKRVPMADEDHIRAQASHKQKPATDADLDKFYAWASKESSFADMFLVAEFTGCRGKEFAKGVRVEALKIADVATLRFHVEGAKCDGHKKGLELRGHEIPFPSEASESVKRRWVELANKAVKKGGIVFKLESVGNSSPGRRFTEACRTVSDAVGVKIGAYAFRQRFSSQVKAANKGNPDAAINVALALGHQTTETQQHYARAHGKSGISPVGIKGINVMGAIIRGASQRTGPPIHVRQKAILKKALPAVTQKPAGPRL